MATCCVIFNADDVGFDVSLPAAPTGAEWTVIFDTGEPEHDAGFSRPAVGTVLTVARAKHGAARVENSVGFVPYLRTPVR